MTMHVPNLDFHTSAEEQIFQAKACKPHLPMNNSIASVDIFTWKVVISSYLNVLFQWFSNCDLLNVGITSWNGERAELEAPKPYFNQIIPPTLATLPVNLIVILVKTFFEEMIPLPKKGRKK